MRYFDRVIVALAHAPVDRDLLRYARLVRRMGDGGGSFTFVHVLPPADVVAVRRGPATTLADTRRALAAVIAEEFGDIDAATLIVRSGDPVDFLLGLAAEGGADLVMVGHRKGARGRRSFSRRLAIKAPCSVWMVPEGAPASISSVLAAVDLSLPSAQALSLATLVANRAGLDRCTVLHVLEPSEIGYDEKERVNLMRSLERFVSPIELHEVSVVPVIEESGSVAGVVNAMVTGAGHDLVVVGTRGRSPSAAVLLGSESEHVLVESRVPVLITKEPGDRIGVLQALLDRNFQGRREPRFG
jgi:nucleotide-binding universal stress UspA family protein